MGINDTPILFWHILVPEVNHGGIYFYTSFPCEIIKTYISYWLLLKFQNLLYVLLITVTLIGIHLHLELLLISFFFKIMLQKIMPVFCKTAIWSYIELCVAIIQLMVLYDM